MTLAFWLDASKHCRSVSQFRSQKTHNCNKSWMGRLDAWPWPAQGLECLKPGPEPWLPSALSLTLAVFCLSANLKSGKVQVVNSLACPAITAPVATVACASQLGATLVVCIHWQITVATLSIMINIQKVGMCYVTYFFVISYTYCNITKTSK